MASEHEQMSDAAFLAGYDPEAFPRQAVTVDIVLLTVLDGKLAALLQRRTAPPFTGHWALPGGFVGIDESLDQAAARVLADKVGLRDAWLEQLYSFGDPGRDPRMRIITVAYFALLPAERLSALLPHGEDLALAEIAVVGTGGSKARASGADGAELPLAFDHARILGHALVRLRGKLDYSRVAFALLPELFTLRQLQHVHEAILGVSLNKPAFRRRILDRGWIEGTGTRESGGAYRPAELYRLRPE